MVNFCVQFPFFRQHVMIGIHTRKTASSPENAARMELIRVMRKSFQKVINRVLKNILKVFVDLCGELWGIV